MGYSYPTKGNGAVFAFEEDGILKILDEYACTNETTQNFLEAVYTKAKSYNPRQIICIDDPTSAHSKGIKVLKHLIWMNSNIRIIVFW
jgi:predicted ATP-grasp superfamily ATP-dependent carboligase